jgi:hypothetical protein
MDLGRNVKNCLPRTGSWKLGGNGILCPYLWEEYIFLPFHASSLAQLEYLPEVGAKNPVSPEFPRPSQGSFMHISDPTNGDLKLSFFVSPFPLLA